MILAVAKDTQKTIYKICNIIVRRTYISQITSELFSRTMSRHQLKYWSVTVCTITYHYCLTPRQSPVLEVLLRGSVGINLED